MSYNYLVARELESFDFHRVVAYGFVTEEGAESEIEAVEEAVGEGTYEVMSYHEENDVKLYYNEDTSTFSRTLTGMQSMA